jgi:nucleotide-binding universal stress UspA family protein
MDDFYIPASVVVGIDGSSAAMRAALWAVDEAVSRDIPLRLIYAIGHPHISVVDADDEARRLATAEIAVRYAFMAVEATSHGQAGENRSGDRPGASAQHAGPRFAIGGDGVCRCRRL